MKFILIFLTISIILNVSLLLVQSFYIPVFDFTMSQANEYNETVEMLNSANVRFRTNITERTMLTYQDEPNIYVTAHEIRVRRSDLDLLATFNSIRMFNAILIEQNP